MPEMHLKQPGLTYSACNKEIKHLILLKIQNMMDVKEVLFLWLVHFLLKNPLKVLVLLHLQINLL